MEVKQRNYRYERSRAAAKLRSDEDALCYHLCYLPNDPTAAALLGQAFTEGRQQRPASGL